MPRKDQHGRPIEPFRPTLQDENVKAVKQAAQHFLHVLKTKLIFPLVAVLCFYGSSNCYALTPEQIKEAESHHKEFVGYYNTLKRNLDNTLREAKEAKKNDTNFDESLFRSYKQVLKEQYSDNVRPIMAIQKENPDVRGTGNKNVKKWCDEVVDKYGKLQSLIQKIETTLKGAMNEPLGLQREAAVSPTRLGTR